MKITIRAFTAIWFAFLLLLPFGAQAQSADGQSAKFLSEIMAFEYRESDLAHNSLAKIYGGFIFSAFGGQPKAPPTVLAKVLGYSNIVALILGCVIMAYVIVGGALNTAASGELLGRSWSSVWLPMRTTIAFGMIMPATDGHGVFSVAQSLIMSLIILGSNSGTWLWEKGVDEIALGTPVMPSANFYTNAGRDSIADILNCAISRERMLRDRKDTSTLSEGHGTSNTGAIIKITSSGIAIPDGTQKITFHGCGEVAFPNAGSALAGTNAEESGEEGFASSLTKGYVPKWEKEMVDNFNTAAKANFGTFLSAAAANMRLLHSYEISAAEYDAVMAENADIRGDAATTLLANIDKAAMAYLQLDDAYRAYNKAMTDAIVKNPGPGKTFAAQAKDGGWMRAGAFMFEATRFQGVAYNLMKSISGTSVSSAGTGLGFACRSRDFATKVMLGPLGMLGDMVLKKIKGCEEQAQKLAENMATLAIVQDRAGQVRSSAGFSGTPGLINIDTEQYKKKALNEEVFKTLTNSLSQVLMSGLLYVGCDNASGTGGSVGECSGGGEGGVNDTSGLVSPFTVLSGIGHGMLAISSMAWLMGLAAVFFAGAGASVPVVGGVSAVIYYLVGSLMAAAVAITSMGFVLAYMLPFMPVIAWIMLSIGYMINTIEAMAAAPLAIIMMATPEGEGLSGANMQRAIQLVNSIILRPSLSIIGLFAAMTLGYAAFSLINNLFWTVASTQNGTAIFGFIAITALYISICYRAVQAMIGLMAKIPNEILEWMAGGVAREFGSQADESVHRTGQMDGLGSDGASQGMASAKGHLGKKRPKQTDKE